MEHEIFAKIFEARKKIKDSNLKKLGYNKYSEYYYYTPEQVEKLVSDTCNELHLLNIFELKRTELGLIARLRVIDIDSGKEEIFESATDIPTIKATNVAQQIGGCMTYSERYILSFLYGIKDNNLDYDSKKPEKKLPEIKPNTDKWEKAKQTLLSGEYTIEQIRTKYYISDENEKLLKDEV